MCYIYHGEGFLYHGEVSFLSNTDLTDLTDWTDECPVAIEEIKKFVAFPWACALAARCVCSAT